MHELLILVRYVVCLYRVFECAPANVLLQPPFIGKVPTAQPSSDPTTGTWTEYYKKHILKCNCSQRSTSVRAGEAQYHRGRICLLSAELPEGNREPSFVTVACASTTAFCQSLTIVESAEAFFAISCLSFATSVLIAFVTVSRLDSAALSSVLACPNVHVVVVNAW